MKNNILRRIAAYFLDAILVMFIITGLEQIKVLNPHYEKFELYYNEYVNLIENIGEDTEKLQELLESELVMELTYNINFYNISGGIITIGVYLLYFVGFQLWTKGQSLGKKLMKLKIISDDEEKLNVWQLFLRTFILYGLLFTIVNLILIRVLPMKLYFNVNDKLALLNTIILYTSAFLMIFRKDGKSLHDLICKTKVVRE